MVAQNSNVVTVGPTTVTAECVDVADPYVSVTS